MTALRVTPPKAAEGHAQSNQEGKGQEKKKEKHSLVKNFTCL